MLLNISNSKKKRCQFFYVYLVLVCFFSCIIFAKETAAQGNFPDIPNEINENKYHLPLKNAQPPGGSKQNPSKKIYIDPITEMVFVWVDGGCFMMGSYKGHENERPVHQVCLDGFWMSTTEVTQGQWQMLMTENPSQSKSGENYPVDTVPYEQAKKFIEKLWKLSGKKYSLPTEAQWEYAATNRGQNPLFSESYQVDAIAWINGNSNGHTHPVGRKKPNNLGLYDLSGNVWEWCKDVYLPDAYQLHSNRNPVINQGGSERVIRGGSWYSVPDYARSTYRTGQDMAYIRVSVGFRLVIQK